MRARARIHEFGCFPAEGLRVSMVITNIHDVEHTRCLRRSKSRARAQESYHSASPNIPDQVQGAPPRAAEEAPVRSTFPAPSMRRVSLRTYKEAGMCSPFYIPPSLPVFHTPPPASEVGRPDILFLTRSVLCRFRSAARLWPWRECGCLVWCVHGVSRAAPSDPSRD